MDSLDDMRKSIDNIDNALLAMFAERFKVTQKIGFYKAEHGLQAKDPTRESAQFSRIEQLAIQYGLDAEFARSMLAGVIEQVVTNHINIAKDKLLK